jgi:hypothetical protein
MVVGPFTDGGHEACGRKGWNAARGKEGRRKTNCTFGGGEHHLGHGEKAPLKRWCWEAD